MKCKYCDEYYDGDDIILNGGAMLMSNWDTQCGTMDDRMNGFLTLILHGEYQSEAINITDNNKGGQFEFYFCSRDCIIDWFIEQVNHITRK